MARSALARIVLTSIPSTTVPASRALARRLGLALVALVATAGAALAQVPKLGGMYKDTADLGFHVKVPAEWDLIPPQPGEKNLIAKFDPPTSKYIELGLDDNKRPKVLWLSCWILKFDRRPQPEGKDEKGPARFNTAYKNLDEWIKKAREIPDGGTMKLEAQKDFTADKIAATEYQYLSIGDPKLAVRVLAASYKLSADVDIGVVFIGPGESKKWTKYDAVYTPMLRSFGVETLKEVAGSTAQGDSLRDLKRAELTKSIATQPGWKLHETANYFILTPHTDRAFVEELKMRLEAIRLIFEQDYPAAKAEELRKAGEGARTGGEKSDEEKARDKAMAEIMGEEGDPKELSRCSVVRVFTDQSAYHSYGGPGGSAGYWSPMHKELVLFDDQAGGGRNDTWIVLNHEAFHQYIYYFYGNISPHSWYNEGTGDFYSGYFWKNGKFILQANKWRKTQIAEAVRAKDGAGTTYCPLDVFVRWDQREYYGSNEYKLDGGANYAQGWSFIYFLRTGKKNNAKGWDVAWDGILETYLKSLAMSGKVEQAVEEAFRGIDMAALEKAWIEYTR